MEGQSTRSFPQFSSERFVVERKLGEGGQGAVYLATETRLNRKVAIKVLNAAGATSDQIRRFKREGTILAALKNDHIPEAFASDETIEGDPCLVMEYVNGPTLQKRLKDDVKLAPYLALHVCHHVGLALRAAHAEGVLHRDVKPANIIIGAGNNIVLVDWGYAYGPGSRYEQQSGEPRLTRPGVVILTEGYVSPEEMSGQQATSRSDVFSLGCVLYEATTGEMAFPGSGRLRDAFQRVPHRHRDVFANATSVIKLIDRTIDQNAEERPEAADLVEMLDAAMIDLRRAWSGGSRRGATGSFDPNVLGLRNPRILKQNPRYGDEGTRPFVPGSVEDARTMNTIHLVQFTSIDRDDLKNLDRVYNEKNKKFDLRLYLPPLSRDRRPFEHVVIMFNGLAEASSKIMDDVGLSFAESGTPAILLPLPCHLSRFVQAYSHDDAFRPERPKEHDGAPADGRKPEIDRLYSQQLLQCIHAHPDWIYHAWEQLRHDTSVLIEQLREQDGGRDLGGLLTENARVSLFGYSLGGLYALALMLDDLKTAMAPVLETARGPAGAPLLPSDLDDTQRAEALAAMGYSSLFLLESGLPIDQVETSRLYYRSLSVSALLAEHFLKGTRADHFQKFERDGIGRLFATRIKSEREQHEAFIEEARTHAGKHGDQIFERNLDTAARVWESIIWELHQKTPRYDTAGSSRVDVFRRVFLGENPGLYKSYLDVLQRRILIITGGEDEIFPAARILTSSARGLAVVQIPGLSHWLKAGAAQDWAYWRHLVVETMRQFETTAARSRMVV